MTTRTSILTLAALAAVSAMAIATTSASAAGGFLPQHPVSPGQIVENCNGNPRLGCAVHIEPTRVTPVAACPWRHRIAVRVAASIPFGVVVRHIPGPFSPISRRHHVWY